MKLSMLNPAHRNEFNHTLKLKDAHGESFNQRPCPSSKQKWPGPIILSCSVSETTSMATMYVFPKTAAWRFVDSWDLKKPSAG